LKRSNPIVELPGLPRYGLYGPLAIFSGTSNPDLAQEIADYLGRELGNVEVIQFANQNIFARLQESVRSKDVFLIQSACAGLRQVRQGDTWKVVSSSVNDNILELLVLIDTLQRDSAGRITAVMPYFAYGRTDKKDKPRVPITARLVADLVSVAGANRFLVLDLHAGQIQGFFDIPGDELTARHILVQYFQAQDIPDAVIVAPDIGASRRARNFAEDVGLPLTIVEKRRISRPGRTATEMLNLIGDVRGKNAIIFDDEIDTGGTIREAADFLRQKEARDVYAYATHAILSPPYGVRNLQAANLRELVVTNTVWISEEKRHALPNMHVLSVAELLGEVIRRIHLGISVGEMFDE
jgi:ribose-phosphate pyrophosphokinase